MKRIVATLVLLACTACAHNLNNEPVVIPSLSDLDPGQSKSKNCVHKYSKSNWGYASWNQILFQEDANKTFLITISGGTVPLKFSLCTIAQSCPPMMSDIGSGVSFCEGDEIVLFDGLTGQTQRCRIVSVSEKPGH